MSINFVNSFVSWMLRKRFHQIEFFIKFPNEVQQDLLAKLLQEASKTEIGIKYGFESINSYKEFSERVPIVNYEDIAPQIERNRQGKQNIFWHSKIKWFAKSSGTSNDKSKYIPISQECLNDSHLKAGKDLLSIYCNNNPDTMIFSGKGLKLGGSYAQYQNDSFFGDLSAIMIENLPFWADIMSSPSVSVALEKDWEKKTDAIIKECRNENITSIAGVPSWMLSLLKEIIKREKISSLLDIWPNLEVFMHGGINFKPYSSQFQKLIPSAHFKYYEVYNASEGFFAIQDSNHSKDMLLMLDYGVFFEFVPLSQFDEKNLENCNAIPLSEVAIGVNYAMIITTNTGLWRYNIGDTIQFVSIFPHRIIVTGRTKNYINTFGEELMIHNVENALSFACAKTKSSIKDFTIAPVYMQLNKPGHHQWLIEFEDKPSDINLFNHVLDQKLQSINSDYEAKRFQNITMSAPDILIAKDGLFFEWLKRKNKLGGQNKIPRMKDNRDMMENLLELQKEI